MPLKMTIDKELQDVIVKVKEVFDKHAVDSCIIGSTATYFQIALKNDVQMAKTNDVDYLINADSTAKYNDTVKDLIEVGFERTKIVHRLKYGAFLVDIIPLGDQFVHNNTLKWPETDSCMDVSGIKYVFSEQSEEVLFGRIKWKVANAPVQVLTKIIAYLDRKKDKDLADIVFVFEQFESSGDCRYECAYSPFECSGAYLVGAEVKRICIDDHGVLGKIRLFLKMFHSVSVPEIDMVLREQGVLDIDGDKRKHIFDLFQAFQSGVGP